MPAGPQEADATHLYASVDLPPAGVVRRFGAGNGCDAYKVSREWVFRKGDLVFTLYDWKATSLYDRELPSPESLWASEKPFPLHIGSRSPATHCDVEAFAKFLRTEVASTAPAHTPGPWQVACDSYGKVRHSRMACVFRGKGTNEEPLTNVAQRIRNWKDARLIAAAPELLDACKFTLDLLDHLPSSEYARGGDRPAREKLMEVIHKATGEIV